jgi:hypothetical protein
MRHLRKTLWVFPLLMFVAACAAPSVQEVSGEGETGKKYKTVISKSGVRNRPRYRAGCC